MGCWSGPAQEAFLVYPSRRYQPARVRVLLDYLGAEIARLPGFTPA